MDTKLAK